MFRAEINLPKIINVINRFYFINSVYRRIIMYRKVIQLILFVLALGVVFSSVAKAANTDLVGWWRLDEGLGTRASDSSGLGNHGTLQGNPQWVAGIL